MFNTKNSKEFANKTEVTTYSGTKKLGPERPVKAKAKKKFLGKEIDTPLGGGIDPSFGGQNCSPCNGQTIPPAGGSSVPVLKDKILESLENNIFPIELLGPQATELIHQAKSEILSDQKKSRVAIPKYSPEDILKAAIGYSLSGSISEVSKLFGIDAGTIRTWKYKPWWGTCLRICRFYHTIDTDIQIRNIRGMALDTVQNALQSPEGVDLKTALQALRVTEQLTVNNDKRLHTDLESKAEVLDSLEQIKSHMKQMSVLYKAKDITSETHRVPWQTEKKEEK